jgi:hypothetical protein
MWSGIDQLTARRDQACRRRARRASWQKICGATTAELDAWALEHLHGAADPLWHLPVVSKHHRLDQSHQSQESPDTG